MTLIRRNPETVARLASVSRRKARDAVSDQRRAAFAAEADPLFFQVQRGEAGQDQYDAVIADIRARFPYPKEA